jgi:LysM repeat protein
MSRLIQPIARILCVFGLLLATAAPARAEEAPASLGQHTVVKGDTLYCLGRAYRVDPAAIARINKLARTARLIIGQVLIIPSVEWKKVPAGPVCATQFQSPYEGAAAPQAAPAEATATATPAPSETLVPANSEIVTYTVKRGDTLSRIARQFNVTVPALQAANKLAGTTIYVGQVLIIPSTEPPKDCVIKGNISVVTGEKIYHVPGGAFYEVTVIRPEYGERWFCTEDEAVAAGWRKSER